MIKTMSSTNKKNFYHLQIIILKQQKDFGASQCLRSDETSKEGGH